MNKLLKVLGTKEAIDSIIQDYKDSKEDNPWKHEKPFGYKPIWIEKPVYELDELITEGVPSGNYQLDIFLYGENDVDLHGAEILDLDMEGNTRITGYSYLDNK